MASLEILLGILVAGCATVGLFFFRFWRQTKDRFFVFFAIAFWILTIHWLALGLTNPEQEIRVYFYLLRLAAFLLILAAIVDKNRSGRES
jgi:hypothetical protein